jgi:predicted enzyme related to lactoylglutathione lyase
VEAPRLFGWSFRSGTPKASVERRGRLCRGTILACYDALADGDAEPVGPNPQNVYFSVDAVDAVHERAGEAGCRELTDVQVMPWGERSFYARDPFGNPICFVDSRTLFTGDRPV